MTRYSSGLIVITLIFLCLATAVSAQEHEDVGFVLYMDHAWLMNGNRLAEGQGLPVGAIIYPENASDPGRICVSLYTGEAPVYTTRFKLPQRVEPGLLSRIWAAVAGHYQGGSVHAISRGDDLLDAVVKLDRGRVDLSPAFKNMRGGSYLLDVRKLNAAGQPAGAAATQPVPFNWSPAAAPASIAGLSPGLYQLFLLDTRSPDHEPTGDSAWVLVVGPGDFQGVVNSYGEGVALTGKWGPGVKPEAARAFLRAYLESLASGSGRR